MTTTNDEAPATIIKSDRSGRRRYTQAYKNEVLAAYESSGMSGPAFAKHCGVKYPTFASWVSKRQGEGVGGNTPKNDQRFVLAEFAASSAAGGLIVELPGGSTARLNSTEQVELLAALIKSLA